MSRAVFDQLLPSWEQQGLVTAGASTFDDLLTGPPLPRPVRYLWLWFAELHAGRTVNALGPSRASHLDVWAWQQNSGIRCLPWEVRALTALGETWVAVMAG